MAVEASASVTTSGGGLLGMLEEAWCFFFFVFSFPKNTSQLCSDAIFKEESIVISLTCHCICLIVNLLQFLKRLLLGIWVESVVTFMVTNMVFLVSKDVKMCVKMNEF